MRWRMTSYTQFCINYISRAIPGSGGGHIWAILVHAVEQGMVLRFPVLKQGIFFDPFVAVVLVWSLARVAKLYYLILGCENTPLNQCLGLKRVSVFAFLALNRVRVQEPSQHIPIQNLREYLPWESYPGHFAAQTIEIWQADSSTGSTPTAIFTSKKVK